MNENSPVRIQSFALDLQGTETEIAQALESITRLDQCANCNFVSEEIIPEADDSEIQVQDKVYDLEFKQNGTVTGIDSESVDILLENGTATAYPIPVHDWDNPANNERPVRYSDMDLVIRKRN